MGYSRGRSGLVLVILLAGLTPRRAMGETPDARQDSAAGDPAPSTGNPAGSSVGGAQPAVSAGTGTPSAALVAAPPATTRPVPDSIDYSRGFVLRSPRHHAELKLNASTHFDARAYPGAGAPDSFDVRRARLELNGKTSLAQVRFQVALEDTPYLRNAYADLGPTALHLRVGQYKAPLSTQWITADNESDFMELSASEPLTPFLERGVMLWGDLLGGRLSYDVGVFDGNGVDSDAPRGDANGSKEVMLRLFARPFRAAGVPWLRGLRVAVGGSFEPDTSTTRRFESGLAAPDFESQVWRWRTQQTLGTNGRDTDALSATIGRKLRGSAELYWLVGSLALGSEWIVLRYEDVTVFHDYLQGTSRLRHEPVITLSGNVHSVVALASFFVTGEHASVGNFGWVQPSPLHPLGGSEGGLGALELRARVSAVLSDDSLFAGPRVAGFAPGEVPQAQGPLPAVGSSVTATALQGATKVYELTGGVTWTPTEMIRVMVEYTYLVDPRFAAGRDGIVQASRSELPNGSPEKYELVESVHEAAARIIFRL